MLDGMFPSGVHERLLACKGFVFDLDGTLALGDPRGHGLKPLPGASEMLGMLRRLELPFVVFTNGTLRTPKETAAKLREAGLLVSDSEAMTPSSVAAAYFLSRRISPVLVLGCEGVWRPLAEAGVEVVLPRDFRGDVKAVYVGWHREFTMSDLENAFDAVSGGASLYTASNVPFFATAGGRALGTSFAICAMLKALTGKSAVVLGKPAAQALKAASRKLGVDVERLAVVGDDPLCEIRLAHQGGALAVAVATGMTDRAGFERQIGKYRPDLILSGLLELQALLCPEANAVEQVPLQQAV